MLKGQPMSGCMEPEIKKLAPNQIMEPSDIPWLFEPIRLKFPKLLLLNIQKKIAIGEFFYKHQ